MKIKVRKIAEKVEYYKDEITGKNVKLVTNFENGFVEELEIDPKDIGSFSLNKSIRTIGIGKNQYPLTLKSWKEAKKELSKNGVLNSLNLEKRK